MVRYMSDVPGQLRTTVSVFAIMEDNVLYWRAHADNSQTLRNVYGLD